MQIHPYWGNVGQDWAGFSSDITFNHSFFQGSDIEIFLGEEFDEDGDEIEEAPTSAQLDGFAATYQHFMNNMESCLDELCQKAFERYQRLYAHYYEHTEESGEPPLNVDTIDKHDPYIKELMYLRVLEGHTVKLTIRYELDTEHGMEFRFENGLIAAVGGIATT
ncbi:hypothetical protein PBAL39_19040 [Pedobacter sp. BAL39]|uniref:DUF6985 domain-containing protein n=1 Tax=Pedobacter sp. BAL39 TaxID=391596 RepID=UPI000155AA1A|nr:hypothetical protein [Pedobacter sp. BAL39]EDM34417.1 hypothetical protein PBAL39_19040 [Pedobacter sp. BAL39]